MPIARDVSVKSPIAYKKLSSLGNLSLFESPTSVSLRHSSYVYGAWKTGWLPWGCHRANKSVRKYQVPHRYSRLPLPFLTGRPLTSHLATDLGA